MIDTNHTSNLIKSILEYQFKISREQIFMQRRFRTSVIPRQISHVIARKYTCLSLNEIAYEFGNKSHATVMNSIKVIGELTSYDKSLRSKLDFTSGIMTQVFRQSHELIADSIIHRFSISRDTFFKKTINGKENRYMASAIYIMRKLNFESEEQIAKYFEIDQSMVNGLLMWAEKMLIINKRFFILTRKVVKDVEQVNDELFKSI